MARSLKIEVVGVADVRKTLREFGIKAADAQQAVVKKAGELMREAIAEKAEGDLANHIIMAESEENTAQSFSVDVGPSYDPAWWAHFVEMGTSPHPIKRDGKALKHGPDDYANKINHPGAGAKPFMRPAFEENIDKAVETAASEYKKKLDL